jgi:hypothetical protein
MFDWRTYWHYHRRKWWLDQRPKLFGGLTRFPRDLLRSWPKKEPAGTVFAFFFYWVCYLVPLYVLWVVTDWLLPVHPLFSLAVAFLIWYLARAFWGNLRGR